MPKTKLEIYVDLLKILVQNDSLKKTNVEDARKSSNELKMCLVFLVKEGFVDERKVSHNRMVYLITNRGIRVLKHFKELKPELPIIGGKSDYQRALTPSDLVN